MKSSISISALAIALATTIVGTSAATALEAYKTKIDQYEQSTYSDKEYC